MLIQTICSKSMKKNQKKRNGFIHLYNPKEEGLGCYDLNYINAYRKARVKKNKVFEKNHERFVA